MTAPKWGGPWIGTVTTPVAVGLVAVGLVAVGFDGTLYVSSDAGHTWAVATGVSDLAAGSAHQPDEEAGDTLTKAGFKAISVAGVCYYPVCSAHNSSTGIRSFTNVGGTKTSGFFALPHLQDFDTSDLFPAGAPMLKGWATDDTNIYVLALYATRTVCLQFPIADLANSVEIAGSATSPTPTSGAGVRDVGSYVMAGLVFFEGEVWCASWKSGFSGVRHLAPDATVWTDEAGTWTQTFKSLAVLGGDPDYLWVEVIQTGSNDRLLYTRSAAGVWALRSTATLADSNNTLKLVWAGAGGKLLYQVVASDRTWKYTDDYGATWTAVGTASSASNWGIVVAGPERAGKVLISEGLWGATLEGHIHELDLVAKTLTDITGAFAPSMDQDDIGVLWFGEYE